MQQAWKTGYMPTTAGTFRIAGDNAKQKWRAVRNSDQNLKLWEEKLRMVTSNCSAHLSAQLCVSSNTTVSSSIKWICQWEKMKLIINRTFHRCFSLILIKSQNFRQWAIFSIPEPKAHWWAYSIGRPPSSIVVVHCPHSLNISSETTEPVKVIFHMECLSDGGTKVCSNGPGHITKMAAMPT